MSVSSSAGEPSFDDIYDAATLRALDAVAAGHIERPARRGVGGVPAAAIASALVSGVREAVEPAEPEPVVEHADAVADDQEAVTLLFVPGDPDATIAIVRPWLLAG